MAVRSEGPIALGCGLAGRACGPCVPRQNLGTRWEDVGGSRPTHFVAGGGGGREGDRVAGDDGVAAADTAAKLAVFDQLVPEREAVNGSPYEAGCICCKTWSSAAAGVGALRCQDGDSAARERRRSSNMARLA